MEIIAPSRGPLQVLVLVMAALEAPKVVGAASKLHLPEYVSDGGNFLLLLQSRELVMAANCQLEGCCTYLLWVKVGRSSSQVPINEVIIVQVGSYELSGLVTIANFLERKNL
jgi:hypothetical protein